LNERISKITQQWFLTEPLLFGAWSTHQVVLNEQIKTIRVGRGRIEFNSDFANNLDDQTLREVMKFETLRIILKHPYERRKPHLEFALTASNIAINECTTTSIPMPTAQQTFGTADHNQKYFEYYYTLLAGQPGKQSAAEPETQELKSDSDSREDSDNENPEKANSEPENEDDSNSENTCVDCEGEG